MTSMAEKVALDHFAKTHIIGGNTTPNILSFMAVTIGNAVVVKYVIATQDGQLVPDSMVYNETEINNLLYPENISRLCAILDVLRQTVLDRFLNVDPDDNERILELKTRRCIECNKVIEIHDDIKWRFTINTIRCDECIRKLVDDGFDPGEARYVA